MKVKILGTASQDLMEGYKFYDKQDLGLGSYFLDSLFSDIDSLLLYAGTHPNVFRLQYIIELKIKIFLFVQFWIAEEIQLG